MSDLVMPPNSGLAASSGSVARKSRRPARFGLATRVLILVTAFVMTAAAMIYVPAISTFRDNWLRNRLSAVHTAALVLDVAPQAMVPPELTHQLLESVGACIIVLSKNGTKRILAASELPRKVDEVFDFRAPAFWPSPTAMATLVAPPGRYITVIGDAPMGGESIAFTMKEAPLTKAMRAYSLRLLIVTLLMSAVVATLATVAIHFMVLRPVRRLTTSIVDFGANPEKASGIIVPSHGSHEIAFAEEELAIMQDTLSRELNEKKHLATLGLAVAKINHDMRNMLAPAQLISDRLANVDDPLVQRLAPKLVSALDRAIRFCQATLAYGRAVDDPPKPAAFLLSDLVTEVTEMVRLEAPGEIEFINAVSPDVEIVADREQMFRVLMNLIRNGVEALANARAEGKEPFASIPQVRVEGWRNEREAVIEVSDTGPGVPLSMRAQLFTPFSSSRAGGSGLGLVIAADLVRGHGGTISLVTGAHEKKGSGATFRIVVPQSVAEASH